MLILHVTAHMGGGAGNAISNIIQQDKRDEHLLISLQRSAKRQYVSCCEMKGTKVLEEPSMEEANDWMAQADVIVVHWWHHPLMCEFLAKFPKELSTRLVLWSHISGCGYPHLREEFALSFERVYFTTPFSYENVDWSKQGNEKIRKHSTVLYGIGNLDEKKYGYRKHNAIEECVVGYVGTLGNAKLHPLFIDYCKAVIDKVPKCHFLLVGDETDAKWLQEEIKGCGLENYFTFTGYCENVSEQLGKMDIFGYPLNPNHFGTTENVVLEAMLRCLPVVMLRQNTEKYIVDDGKTGFLVESVEEYGSVIAKLYEAAELRNAVGSRARELVLGRYNSEMNSKKFHAELETILLSPKKRYSFENICGKYPYQWFLSGMNEETRSVFESFLQGDITDETLRSYLQNGGEILRGESKSSIRHFGYFFPKDDVIKQFDRAARE